MKFRDLERMVFPMPKRRPGDPEIQEDAEARMEREGKVLLGTEMLIALAPGSNRIYHKDLGPDHPAGGMGRSADYGEQEVQTREQVLAKYRDGADEVELVDVPQMTFPSSVHAVWVFGKKKEEE